ncbi:hypothetical protein LH464_22950 [Neorhizobium sp. T786]|uniref:hypothetical protein n=1 Tax=Pseudorhizobium xiangyangii TaxID=2883104 RepID=UPI001CFFBE13|nr:hypothetical protein [Neorhizobium xiangyangii]MCB5205324.1 hypothetical protein [Neorhizobium xiangyangii]
MIFVSHIIDHTEEKAQANALRRYIKAKAAGRKSMGYVYPIKHDSGIVGWVGCDKKKAQQKAGSRRYRQPGPWCDVLGHDTSIKDDQYLTAFFGLNVTDDAILESHDWNRLLPKVTTDRVKALRAFRLKGMEILDRQARRQSSAAVPAAAAKSLVSSKYMKKGEGVRPLKLLKTTN